MKKITLTIILICILMACKNKQNKAPQDEKKQTINTIDETLITDSTWGLINATTQFADLKKLLDSTQLKDERICGPECIDSIDVTKIYYDTKNEAIIYWQDSAYHKKIAFITAYKEASDWHTSDGLKIGSPLIALLRLNGKAITFSGFGWDYGGAISSYQGGKLETSPIEFGLDKPYNEKDTSIALLGDQVLNTDSPFVKKELPSIIIRRISLSL
ncbi:MAG: hypothetical protein RIR12_368 [Bacteroidota bacterium]